MAKAGIVRYGRVSATRQDAAGRKRVMTQWVSALALISLLLASCGRTQPPAPPPGEGVRLAGEPDSPAADHLLDMPPVGVDPSQIENGILLTRLDVRIAPDATVAQINEALRQVNGGIVSMSSDHLFMTVAVPRQADFEALQALADTLSAAPGIHSAFPGREMVVDDWPFPEGGGMIEGHHLIPPRFPAAWNLGQRLEEGCDRVPVVIVDKFSPNPPGNFRTQVPGFPAVSGSDDQFHGYYVASILAAIFDDQQPTGANPFIECLDLRPIDISTGLTAGQTAEYVADRLPTETFILNGSFGFDSICDAGCAPETILEDIALPLYRAEAALAWKELTNERWNDFLVVASAGNNYDKESSFIYDGLGEAPYRSILTIAALDDPLFRFVQNTDLWNANEDYAQNGYLPLVPTFEEAMVLEQHIRDIGMDRVPPANNVLIVGSTSNTLVQTDIADSSTITESGFSNRNPNVFAVGENILPVCDSSDSECVEQRINGTSFSTPQVAGLAAFLWLLEPELRRLPASVTRELILANTRILPSGVRLIDAYASALALDGVFGFSPTATPNRFALLDITKDNRVDEVDIAEFLSSYFESNGDLIEPADPELDRYDLNGDGYTGGMIHRDRFDLDRSDSVQYGASTYSASVMAVIEEETIRMDEHAVTDLDVLCYYMYSDLYSGDPDVREELLRAPCLENAISPETVTLSPGEIQQFTAFLPGTDPVSWVAECGTITDEGLYTACDTEGIYTIQAGRGDHSAQADVFVEVLEDPAEPTSTPTNTPTSTPTSTPTATPTFTPTPTATPQVLTYNSVTHASPTNSGLQATITITFTGENGTQTHTAVYPHANTIESFDTHEITMVQHAVYQVTIDYQIREGGYFLSWATATSPVSDRNCTVIGQPSFPGRVENGRTIRWRPGTIDPNSMQEVPLAGQITFELRCDR